MQKVRLRQAAIARMNGLRRAVHEFQAADAIPVAEAKSGLVVTHSCFSAAGSTELVALELVALEIQVVPVAVVGRGDVPDPADVRDSLRSPADRLDELVRVHPARPSIGTPTDHDQRTIADAPDGG